jgi:hypothetical protein
MTMAELHPEERTWFRPGSLTFTLSKLAADQYAADQYAADKLAADQ